MSYYSWYTFVKRLLLHHSGLDDEYCATVISGAIANGNFSVLFLLAFDIVELAFKRGWPEYVIDLSKLRCNYDDLEMLFNHEIQRCQSVREKANR